MAQVGKYELVRKLATGGMAEVFLAKAAGPMGFEKLLVVKRILPHLVEDPQFVEMFLSEAKLAAQLNHHNVVQIFDFGESEGTYFIAMEYIDGPNLRTLSQRAFETGLSLPFAHCAKLISLACDGLAYAHELTDPQTGEPLNLIHRDISPDNILLTRNGGVKVVDFGIAKARTQSHRTESGVLKGKIAYMSPEHLAKKPLDARADVYALGVVLYSLATGQKPFDAESEVELMLAALNDPIVKPTARRPDIPERFEGIIEKALTKDREQRYQSCRELQADLESFIQARGERVGAHELSQLVAKLVPPTPGMPGAVKPTPAPQRTPVSKATLYPAQVAPETKEVRAPPKTKVFEEPTARAPTAAVPDPEKRAAKRQGVGVAAAVGVALLGLAGGGGYLALRSREAAPAPQTSAPEPAKTPAVPTSPQAPAAPVPASPEPLPADPSGSDEQTAAANPAQQMASFFLESVPAGQVRVNGKLFGTTPLRIREIPAGKARVEVFGEGFSREETFALTPGDNGAKRIVVQKGRIEFRVRPYAVVTVDGIQLGATPLPPIEVYEGRHNVRFVNAELHKDETKRPVVTSGRTTTIKIDLSM